MYIIALFLFAAGTVEEHESYLAFGSRANLTRSATVTPVFMDKT